MPHETVDEYRKCGDNRSTQSAPRELEDGENSNRDMLMHESILAGRIGMSAIVVFCAYISSLVQISV